MSDCRHTHLRKDNTGSWCEDCGHGPNAQRGGSWSPLEELLPTQRELTELAANDPERYVDLMAMRVAARYPRDVYREYMLVRHGVVGLKRLIQRDRWRYAWRRRAQWKR